jgi:hypothetical protein
MLPGGLRPQTVAAWRNEEPAGGSPPIDEMPAASAGRARKEFLGRISNARMNGRANFRLT